MGGMEGRVRRRERAGGAPGDPISMPLDRLLRLLVCPGCREPVQPDSAMSHLRCGRCQEVYPVLGGVPIMLTSASRSMLAGGREAAPASMEAEPAWRARVVRFFRSLSPGGPGLDPNQEARIRSLVTDLGDGAAILDLGSGGLCRGSTVIAMDIDRFPNVGLVGDGHRLPFGDGSLDGVICTGVLEHVQNAEAMTREIWRVIRPGGLTYISVPFIEGFHPGAGTHMDYRRLTHIGLQQHLAAFEQVDFGVSGGPSAALASVLREYLALLFFDGGRGYSAAYLVAGWLTCWMPRLDRVLSRRVKAHRIAFGFYVLARKPAGMLPAPAEHAA